MTPRANSLTGRDTTSARPVSQTWTMSAGDVRAFLEAMGRLGYDVAALLGAVGLQETMRAGPDARVSCDALGKMFGIACQQRVTPNLALELARVTPLGAYPLLDYLIATSDTVGAGARQLARYFRLVGSPIAHDIDESADPVHVEMATSAAPFAVEYNAALMVLHFRNETNGRFAAARVTFRHAVDDARGWEQILGCPIVVKAAATGVVIALSAWQLPLRRRDPVLRQVL